MAGLKKISKGIMINWVITILFSLSIFSQLLIGQWQLWHSLLWSSLFRNPHTFWAFYLPKIGISLLLGSLIFLFKKKRWSIIVSFLIDVWIFAELIYYRANGVFLDFYTMTMVGNMKGFWGSVPMYVKAFDWVLLLISATYAIVVISFDKRQKENVRIRSIYSFAAYFILFLGINFWSTKEVATQCNSTKLTFVYFDPFSRKAHDILAFQGYEKNYSLIHSFVYVVKQAAGLTNKTESIQLSEKEMEYLKSIYESNPTTKPKPNSDLVILLVESLEDWAVTEEIMPNLYKFCHLDSNIVYCPNIISQVKKGTSSDGQLIVETGLLPVNEGAVCFRFPQNTFPSLNDLYEGLSSTTLIPTPLSVWNQIKMSRCYKYSTDITCESNDRVALSLLSDILGEYRSILAITVSSHSPFDSVSDSSSLALSPDMPTIMSNYLRSLNYTDCSLGTFLTKYLEKYRENTTLVISGDHTVFYQAQRKDFSKACTKYNLDYNVSRNYTPLIISSPTIQESILVDNRDYYQMDIYPTVLSLLGCSDYYWKGLGINILNEYQNDNLDIRTITEENAFILSDKLIRNDFFNQKKSNR